ncbi:MAG: cupin domain-containing protein [Desulfobacterales bacterium]|nr:cupin domain-containing protein [Desulfobacterales bacterium]MBS3756017.1 cupin domain-containing protein [Desulfobacterales bacterium]
MFCRQAESAWRELMPGIEVRTLVYGEKMLMAQYRLKKGSQLPEHSHPHEQTGFLVSGQIRLHLADEVLDAGPGDSWCIAGNRSHWADVIEDAVAVEVFSPVREDLLP